MSYISATAAGPVTLPALRWAGGLFVVNHDGDNYFVPPPQKIPEKRKPIKRSKARRQR